MTRCFIKVRYPWSRFKVTKFDVSSLVLLLLERVVECDLVRFIEIPEKSVINEVVSLRKAMELEVVNYDIDELLADQRQKLTTVELMERGSLQNYGEEFVQRGRGCEQQSNNLSAHLKEC
ncbi:hypothetical protein TNCV_2588091 [Trichonephila clavipes]|nr:hypothetical protein TNCV_2588091 [Trichonephila clavipes]